MAIFTVALVGTAVKIVILTTIQKYLLWELILMVVSNRRENDSGHFLSAIWRHSHGGSVIPVNCCENSYGARINDDFEPL